MERLNFIVWTSGGTTICYEKPNSPNVRSGRVGSRRVRNFGAMQHVQRSDRRSVSYSITSSAIESTAAGTYRETWLPPEGLEAGTAKLYKTVANLQLDNLAC